MRNRPQLRRGRRWEGRLAGLFIGAALLLLPAAASAAAPELLFQAPEGDQARGGEAGQINGPRSLATDPISGHVYVGEQANYRIGEFTVWGEFVRAWGWDVAPEGAPGDTADDEFEICTSACKAGVDPSPRLDGAPVPAGDRVGQFYSLSGGLAVDGSSGIYAYDPKNQRVQKFDSQGNFEWMIGREVNKDTLASICTKGDVEAGEECGAGAPGAGDREFSSPSISSVLTYNPVTDTLFLGDADRIQEISTDGEYLGEVELDGLFDANYIHTLTVDQVSGDLYLAFPQEKPVYRIDSGLAVFDDPADAIGGGPWIEVGRLVGDSFGGFYDSRAMALASDVDGNLYVANGRLAPSFYGEVLGFDSAGEPLAGMEEGDRFGGYGVPVNPVTRPVSDSILAVATNTSCPGGDEPGNLYVAHNSERMATATVHHFFDAFGPAPTCFEDPPFEPRIEQQYATSVDTDGAIVKAAINPMFWSGVAYYVEYGLGKCTEGGCETVQPLPPGAALDGSVGRKAIESGGVHLDGLLPGRTYHYRFVILRPGGTPAYGIDPDEEGSLEATSEEGLEGTFRTFRREAQAPCPNEELRGGVGARLPDCRAYELVSPLERNNADIITGINTQEYPTALTRSAPAGERLTYSSIVGFGDPQTSPYTSQYLAERRPLGSAEPGWSSTGISPPRTRPTVDPPLDGEYRAFSEDLCWGWLETAFRTPGLGGVLGYRNLHRRNNCGEGSFTAVSTISPTIGPDKYNLRFVGAADDGGRAAFVANGDLPGTGASVNSNGRLQLYVRNEDGTTEFACVLPSGSKTTQACYLGTLDEGLDEGYLRLGTYQNAISSDGERIFWSASANGRGPGKLYVRVRGEASSRAVFTAANARFHAASEGGERVVFSVEEPISAQHPQDRELYVRDVDSATQTLIATDSLGVLGVSQDARRIYFASSQVLGGENSEGAEALPGQPSLYLWEGEPGQVGAYEFIGTLTVGDAANAANPFVAPSPLARAPMMRSSRVTPDGLHAAFTSNAPLTGRDNRDAVSGEPGSEVFLYDAAAAKLTCASCDPSGARPRGASVRKELMPWVRADNDRWVASRIPGWEGPLHGSRALSNDGSRLFFESYGALVPEDTNGAVDVYQWEAPGTGTCTTQKASYGPESGGCVELISSGESPRPSLFVDADESGQNVFFTTLSSLVGPDYDLIDIYDARVEGGFPYPEAKLPCEGEACQSPPSPPSALTPSSFTFSGPGDPKAKAKPSPRCPKGKKRAKRRGKVRCVRSKAKQKKASKKKRAARDGRAAR